MKYRCAALAVSLFSSVLFARPGVVHTRDGMTYDGDVTETDNTVSVRVRGIATTIPKNNIASVSYAENVAADIEARWKKLQPNDVRTRIELGKAAFEARQYLLSRKILQEALELDPNNRSAADLYDLSRAQLELERKRVTTAEASAVAATQPVTPPSPTLTNDRRYVSGADINNIREMEITPRDGNIRLRIEPDVTRRFPIGTDLNPAEFRARPALEQFNAIRAGGRPEFLRNIRVQSDPQTIIEFRRDVQQPVLAGCASSGCHGSPAHPGDFQLIGEVTDPAVYTNFYNLATHTTDAPASAGVFSSGAVRRMIDRSMPENSLILQYMLPPEMATTPHPPIKNVDYRGVVKSKDDPRYQRIAGWIANTLSPTEPQYNVFYKPPFVAAPSPPATEPAK